MALKYRLTQNKLIRSQSPDEHVAIPTGNKTMYLEDIIEDMISRGSTITKAEALATIEEFNRSVCNILSKGNSINTELFSVTHSIKGVFKNSKETFNPQKHVLNLNLRAGKRLLQTCQNIPVIKVDAVPSMPQINTLINLKNGDTNNSVNAGQMVSLRGKLLKISLDKPDCGIYLIDSNKAETKIPHLIKNAPSELMFFIPDHLVPGKYHLELRTYLRKHKKLAVQKLYPVAILK